MWVSGRGEIAGTTTWCPFKVVAAYGRGPQADVRLSLLHICHLTHLFATTLFVSCPVTSILRGAQLIACGPITFTNILFFCSYCTNWMHSSHINLKKLCSERSGFWTPSSIPPSFIQSSIVWIIIILKEGACCDSGVQYLVQVIYADGMRCC